MWFAPATIISSGRSLDARQSTATDVPANVQTAYRAHRQSQEYVDPAGGGRDLGWGTVQVLPYLLLVAVLAVVLVRLQRV